MSKLQLLITSMLLVCHQGLYAQLRSASDSTLLLNGKPFVGSREIMLSHEKIKLHQPEDENFAVLNLDSPKINPNPWVLICKINNEQWKYLMTFDGNLKMISVTKESFESFCSYKKPIITLITVRFKNKTGEQGTYSFAQ